MRSWIIPALTAAVLLVTTTAVGAAPGHTVDRLIDSVREDGSLVVEGLVGDDGQRWLLETPMTARPSPQPTTSPSPEPTTSPSPTETTEPAPTPTVTAEPTPTPTVTAEPSPTHGTEVSRANTGLRAAGYTYDPATDTWAHPEKGALQPRGTITTSSDGQVIEHVDASHIDVDHDDVTVRNSRVSYSGSNYAVDGLYDAQGLTVQNVEIRHVGHAGHKAQAIRTMGGAQITANNMYGGFGTCVGLHGTSGVIEGNYCHGLTAAGGVHSTGLVLEHSGGPFDIRGNHTEGGTSSTITLYARHGPYTDVEIRDNLMSGGTSPSFCLNAGDNKNADGGTRNIRVVNNVFDRDPFPECGRFGPFFRWDASAPGAVWCDNRFVDGEPVGTETGC